MPGNQHRSSSQVSSLNILHYHLRNHANISTLRSAACNAHHHHQSTKQRPSDALRRARTWHTALEAQVRGWRDLHGLHVRAQLSRVLAVQHNVRRVRKRFKCADKNVPSQQTSTTSSMSPRTNICARMRMHKWQLSSNCRLNQKEI